MAALTRPVYVITGARAAGKTRLIQTLLSQVGADECCAILLNDLGATSLEESPATLPQRWAVKRVAGCVCCSAQVALRATLVAAVRTLRPARVLIEASAAAEPASIASVLAEPGLATAVHLQATLAVAHPRQLVDRRYTEHALYRRQLDTANAIAVSAAAMTEYQETLQVLRGLGLTPPVLNSDDVSFAWLDQLRV